MSMHRPFLRTSLTGSSGQQQRLFRLDSRFPHRPLGSVYYFRFLNGTVIIIRGDVYHSTPLRSASVPRERGVEGFPADPSAATRGCVVRTAREWAGSRRLSELRTGGTAGRHKGRVRYSSEGASSVQGWREFTGQRQNHVCRGDAAGQVQAGLPGRRARSDASLSPPSRPFPRCHPRRLDAHAPSASSPLLRRRWSRTQRRVVWREERCLGGGTRVCEANLICSGRTSPWSPPAVAHARPVHP